MHMKAAMKGWLPWARKLWSERLSCEAEDADADADTYDDSDADAAAYGGDEL